MLLVGMETCCPRQDLKFFRKSWIMGSRNYKLRINGVMLLGDFCCCEIFVVFSVLKAKRFFLVLLEERG